MREKTRLGSAIMEAETKGFVSVIYYFSVTLILSAGWNDLRNAVYVSVINLSHLLKACLCWSSLKNYMCTLKSQ